MFLNRVYLLHSLKLYLLPISMKQDIPKLSGLKQQIFVAPVSMCQQPQRTLAGYLARGLSQAGAGQRLTQMTVGRSQVLAAWWRRQHQFYETASISLFEAWLLMVLRGRRRGWGRGRGRGRTRRSSRRGRRREGGEGVLKMEATFLFSKIT